MGFDEILKILGNETRREILQMLATSPCYVSQLSEELHIGQKAIIQHLELMSSAGILASRLERIEKGRPRKYYAISRDFVVEVNVGSNLFDVDIDSPHINESSLDDYPKLQEISEELRLTSSLHGRDKIEKLNEIYEKLSAERENLTELRKAIDYLMGDIRGIIQEESRGVQVRRSVSTL